LAWAYHSKKDGKEITVDMFNAIRDLEKVTGRKYIFTDEATEITKSDFISKKDDARKAAEKAEGIAAELAALALLEEAATDTIITY